jgi:hypothetical protein
LIAVGDDYDKLAFDEEKGLQPVNPLNLDDIFLSGIEGDSEL